MTAQAKRFTDNTSTMPVDRRRVYGFAGGSPYMTMHPIGTNLSSEWIPQGRLILFLPHVEKHVDGDWKPVKLETSAKHYAESVKHRFQDQEDWGYRTLDVLTPLRYDKDTGYDEADAYFATVHPAFSTVGWTCETGLETGTTEVGDPCPTCRIKWLESSDCKALIDFAVEGKDFAPLNRQVLEELREKLLESYRASLAFNQFKLDASNGDLSSRKSSGLGIPALTDADFLRMKMLHRKAEHIEQAELVAKQAEVQGRAIGEAIRSTSGGGDATAGMTTAEKAEFYAWKAEKERKAQEAQEAQTVKCSSTTKDGKPCGNDAKENGKCAVHKEA